MSGCPLRFLHAADLQLHRLPAGAAHLPDDLRGVFIAAPLEAARRVFDAALANAVDFVVLSGGVISVDRATPRALRFLVEQFQRLDQRNVRVYWAGGPQDLPASWPAGLPLPDNVHIFTKDQVESLTHLRGGEPVAAIAGLSNSRPRIHPGEFRPGRDGLFTIAAAHGEASLDELAPRSIHYWALGGRQRAETLAESPATVRYPGAPQGLSPASTGRHGATLVNVDGAGEIRLQALACDVFRWQNEQLTASSITSDEELFQQLVQRTTQLIAGAPERHLLVRWSLEVNDHLRGQLRRDGLAAELTARLQQHFAGRKPIVWTCELAAPAREDVPAELYEEDTILGDFLRSLRDQRHSKGRPLDLDATIASEIVNGDVAAAIGREDAGREQLLRDVAALGVELLSGAALADSNAAKIQFRGGDETKSMTLKHDGQTWAAQQELAALLDEELAS